MPLEKSDAVRRAKSGAGRRAMLEREPKILENPKTLLALKGHATSAVGAQILSDIHILKKPDCKKLQRKNDLLPFEAGGDTHLENLCRLSDCSLFALCNHTKKRPNNLVLGRMFGFRILDMLEFGITNYKPLIDKKANSALSGTAPCVLFNGDDFEATEATRVIKSVLLDIFRAPHDIKRLNLKGLDRVLSFTLVGNTKVLFRHYKMILKRQAGSNLPRPELEEIGPSFDLELRRSQLAPEEMRKMAMKKPRDPRVDIRTKNVAKDGMGDKKGRIHVGRQDLSGLALARMKGLKKRERDPDATADDIAIEDSPKRQKVQNAEVLY